MFSRVPGKSAIVLFALALSGLQAGDRRTSHWHLEHPQGITILVGLNSVSGREAIKVRRIVLLLDARYFTERDLTILFTDLASEYDEPELLSIDAHTDRGEANKEIQAALSPTIMDVGPSLYPEKAPPLLLPSKNTSLRAEYFRMQGKEYFHYKDPISGEYRTVNLRH